MNLKEQIVQAQDLKTEVINIPEWGMDITIRQLSSQLVNDIQDLLAKTKEDDRYKNYIPMFVAFSIIDPDTGERVFGNNDVSLLAKKSGVVLKKIYDAADRLNNINSLEEKAKN